MRNAFAEEMTKLASVDERVVVLSGDIGNKLFDKLKGVDENRFYNCGIAEANMMGVAAGMAMSGLRPFVYTITPFTTTRCFEQIRVDVCYHQAPVVIVGTGSGLSYSELGPTHHSLEDMAILRTLPGMRVIAPCDAAELRMVLHASLAQNSPTYIRIGKKGEPDIYNLPPELQIGKVNVLRPGRDVALLCAGNMMSETFKVADSLNEINISAEIVSFHTIKPLDADYLREASRKFKLLVSIEEHGCIGGLGSAIAEWRMVNFEKITQLSFGTPDVFAHEIGSQVYMREKYGLTATNIAATIVENLNKSKI